MICSSGDKMTWPPVWEIAVAIDDLANTLGIPDYERLQDLTNKPFQYEDKIPASLYMAFHVQGTANVQYAYLSPDSDGVAQYELPHPNLHELSGPSGDSNLFFITEQDECMCSSMFRVVEASTGGHTLEEVASDHCCLTAHVPAPGDSITADGAFFLDSSVARRMLSGNPTEATQVPGKACSADVGALNSYSFQHPSMGSDLIRVTRSLSGYFSWEAKKEYMDDMWDRIKEILDCKNNGGSQVDYWRYGEGENDFIKENCAPTLGELIESMKTYSEPEVMLEEPGCMTEATDFLPWDQPTCEGEECETDKIKFYCETLVQMDAIVRAMDGGLKPREDDVTGCCCFVAIEEDVEDGFMANCGCPATQEGVLKVCRGYDEEFYWTLDVFSGEPGDPPITTSGYCSNTCDYPADPGPSSLCLDSTFGHGSEGPCPEEYTSMTPMEPSANDCVDALDCDALTSAAKGEVSGSSFASVGCGFVSVGQYRLRVNPPEGSSCPGSSAGFEVTYDMVRVFLSDGPNEMSREERTDTLEWDETEGAFVSGWRDYPSGVDAGMDYDVYSSALWAFDFDGENGKTGVRCPRCESPPPP